MFAAAALAMSFAFAGSGSNGSSIFLMLMAAPLCSAVASVVVWRWCFESRGSHTGVSLLCGLAVMGAQLHSGVFLDALAHTARLTGPLPFDRAASLLFELSLVSALTVSSVMLAVLAVEVPFRILLSSLASYEPSGALLVARFAISTWLLFVGASLISDTFRERFGRIVSLIIS